MSLSGKELIVHVRKRYSTMLDADLENRKEAVKDLNFLHVPGAQWDDYLRQERGKRPCYEFNKLRITVKRIVNSIRANRPQGKVRAVEDGDKDTAEVLEGLCRNIWNSSDGDTIIDAAAEFQVGCGYAAWRINTRYVEDEVSNQELFIEAIRNPFCLHCDPAAQDFLKRDAEDWIITERITKKAFEAKYPSKAATSFEGSELDDADDATDWDDGERVRVAEYWWKEPYDKELWLLNDGKTIDSTEIDTDLGRAVTEEDLASIGLAVVKRRTAKAHKIKMAIVSGATVIEEPRDWVDSKFPFVQIYGEYVIIEGKAHWFGATRFSKDAQRNYNVARTSIAETIALTPQAKWWATADQAKGHTDQWAAAHKENFPFMLFNSDSKHPGAPTRMGGADVPVALIQESQIASDDIKAVNGIFDASLGNRSNEQSGVAIRARQNQGEIATFNYADNIAKGIQRTWELLVSAAPKVIDTERSMRILGVDGAEKYVQVNSVDPKTGLALNDITRGKFDVTVTTGPGFATQRLEASETYTAMIQANPALFPIIGDLVLKATDLPYADQMAERIKAMAPPQIQALDNKDGKPMPPEVQQAMQQVQMMQQQVDEHGKLLQQASVELEQKSAEVDKSISELKVQQAQFDADIQRSLAAISAKEAQLVLKEAQAMSAAEGVATDGVKQIEVDRDAFQQEITTALMTIHSQAEQFMGQAAGIINQMQEHVSNQAQEAAKPKPRITRIKRDRGALVPEYGEGDGSPVTRIERQGADLVPVYGNGALNG